MLTILSGAATRTCDGVSRRDFLRAGALGIGGLTLADLFALRAAGATSDLVRDRAVVLLYLSGGASHIETFDPKMSAPEGTRSITGEVQTTLPGVTFGGTFPQLAARAHRLAVVRSFHHSVGDHEAAHVHVLSGGTNPQGKGEMGFSVGSLVARLRGANHPQSGLPTFALLTEEEVDNQYTNERSRVQRGSRPNMLGASYGPFEHRTTQPNSAASKPGRNGKKAASVPASAAGLTLAIPPERFNDRLALLAALDDARRGIDADDAIDRTDEIRRQARDVLLRGAAQAFDFRRENPRLVEEYDTSATKIGHKKFRPSTLGHQMLLARRLCEAGAGFVTVHSAGWDMHADGNNPGIVTGMEMLGRTLDQAVTVFLDDVNQRGLSDKILLVIAGDFGRTPKINKQGGRDHWPRLGSIALAGGGLQMGQVIGSSTRGADLPASDPVTPANLLATIAHAVFDMGKLRADPSVPGEVARAIEAVPPIPRVF